MRALPSVRLASAALAACAAFAGSAPAGAQSIEPRAYSNAPVGVNFLIAGYAQTKGDLDFGPTLPVTESRAARTRSASPAKRRTRGVMGPTRGRA